MVLLSPRSQWPFDGGAGSGSMLGDEPGQALSSARCYMVMSWLLVSTRTVLVPETQHHLLHLPGPLCSQDRRTALRPGPVLPGMEVSKAGVWR